MNAIKTKQAIYNHVRQHLLTQGKKAEVAGKCLYRTAGGAKCAAGCLIPDELYKLDMENRTFCRGWFDDVIKFHGWAETEINLVGALQLVHDNYGPAEWPLMLSEVARTFGLENGY